MVAAGQSLRRSSLQDSMGIQSGIQDPVTRPSGVRDLGALQDKDTLRTRTQIIASRDDNAVKEAKDAALERIKGYIADSPKDQLEAFKLLVEGMQKSICEGETRYPDFPGDFVGIKGDLEVVCTHRTSYFGDENTRTQFLGTTYTNTAKRLLEHIDTKIKSKDSDIVCRRDIPKLTREQMDQNKTNVQSFISTKILPNQRASMASLLYILRIAIKSEFSDPTKRSSSVFVEIDKKKLREYVKTLSMAGTSESDLRDFCDHVLNMFSERVSSYESESFTSSFTDVMRTLTGKPPTQENAVKIRTQFNSGRFDADTVMVLTRFCSQLEGSVTRPVIVGADAKNMNFDSMCLRNIKFSRVVSNCSFNEAALDEVEFKAEVRDSNFNNSTIENSHFNAAVASSNFVGATTKISCSQFKGPLNVVDFTNATCTSVSFHGETLDRVNFIETRFIDSSFKMKDQLQRMRFEECNFNGAKFNKQVTNKDYTFTRPLFNVCNFSGTLAAKKITMYMPTITSCTIDKETHGLEKCFATEVWSREVINTSSGPVSPSIDVITSLRHNNEDDINRARGFVKKIRVESQNTALDMAGEVTVNTTPNAVRDVPYAECFATGLFKGVSEDSLGMHKKTLDSLFVNLGIAVNALDGSQVNSVAGIETLRKDYTALTMEAERSLAQGACVFTAASEEYSESSSTGNIEPNIKKLCDRSMAVLSDVEELLKRQYRTVGLKFVSYQGELISLAQTKAAIKVAIIKREQEYNVALKNVTELNELDGNGMPNKTPLEKEAEINKIRKDFSADCVTIEGSIKDALKKTDEAKLDLCKAMKLFKDGIESLSASIGLMQEVFFKCSTSLDVIGQQMIPAATIVLSVFEAILLKFGYKPDVNSVSSKEQMTGNGSFNTGSLKLKVGALTIPQNIKQNLLGLIQTYSNELDALFKVCFEGLVKSVDGSVGGSDSLEKSIAEKELLISQLRVQEQIAKDILGDSNHNDGLSQLESRRNELERLSGYNEESLIELNRIRTQIRFVENLSSVTLQISQAEEDLGNLKRRVFANINSLKASSDSSRTASAISKIVDEKAKTFEEDLHRLLPANGSIDDLYSAEPLKGIQYFDLNQHRDPEFVKGIRRHDLSPEQLIEKLNNHVAGRVDDVAEFVTGTQKNNDKTLVGKRVQSVGSGDATANINPTAGSGNPSDLKKAFERLSSFPNETATRNGNAATQKDSKGVIESDKRREGALPTVPETSDNPTSTAADRTTRNPANQSLRETIPSFISRNDPNSSTLSKSPIGNRTEGRPLDDDDL